MLLLGFGALCVRGLLFATTSEPYLLVLIQVLDGVTAAALGVLALTIVDLTREHGHFQLDARHHRLRDGVARRQARHWRAM